MKPTDIRFIVSVAQVKTMADGGIRYSFDGSEKDVGAAASIMAVKSAGNALEITARIIPKETNEDKHAEEAEDGEGGSARKTRRYPYRP